ncbi:MULTISPECIES: GNAT family N-acetyltransferase [Sporosarcina]|uniref:GNAT family N-acetyltransferase n=1 Tax=Sporosarcina TaxID=1569 RepID=UPI0005907D1A|nr:MULTISPECIES: GNAT family protein [Sporosarcina]WJY28934.1 GNAT family protein [Sporosarcina sp. 0.2-SM1T-5]
MYRDEELVIRPIEQRDLPRLWELIYKEESPEWKQWDAPYFPHHAKPLGEFMETAPGWVGCEEMWVIEAEGVVWGIVSYYFEDTTQIWLETGIAIHEGSNWNKGVGTRALTMWIAHIFTTLPVPRVGLTTWSGNHRMMRVGEKLGMQLEGRMRNVRFHDGAYYDSIRMGILREEWEADSTERLL